MNRNELQNLARTRQDEAAVLLQEGRFSGAFYLAGYAIECALKACIAKQTQEHDFPEKARTARSHTHDLSSLLGLALLDDELASSDEQLKDKWNFIRREWSEVTRYATWSDEEAAVMLDAVNGVLTWIMSRW